MSTPTPPPVSTDPCLEQRNAVAQSEIEVTAALQLFADRVEALIACEEQHSGGMQPMALKRLKGRHSEIRTDLCMAKQFIDDAKARMLDRKIEKEHGQ